MLLEQPDPTLIAEREYIVTALAAAHLQLGEFARARAVLASIPRGSEQQAYRLPMRQLTTLAEHGLEVEKRGVE